MTLTRTQRGTIIALACAVMFGLYPASIRAVYADGGNAAFVIIVTTWSRAGLLASYCLLRQIRVYDTSEARRLALSGGIMQSLSILGIIGALVFLPGPIVLIILFTYALMLLFYLAWREEAQLDFPTLVSTVSALFGLSFVVDIWQAHASISLIGVLLAFMAAIATAGRFYTFGRQTLTRHPAAIGLETFIVAGILVSFVALFQTPHAPAMSKTYIYLILACASLAFGTFGTFYSIALVGAFRCSLLLKMEPVFTALFSFLLLGEVLKPVQYLGMAIVLISLVTYQIMLHRRAKTALS